ncbi:MAG: 16S rRNA (guanine(527)-N(7))-methyltransferase RsmG [Eubacterium sp.]|nr:16S rRNA (guanine(527)-N(7))-methyltransferase RsmG [Eubacterium sp.]
MHGKELLIKGIEELGIEVNEIQIQQFLKYYEMLVETNKVMNLTGIVDLDEVIVKHFLDSLLVVKVIDMTKYNSMIDVGTGAGFPGIPLKIMFPHLRVTLLDSLNKRLIFLNDVIKELQLENIETVHGRAEDIGKDNEYRERYDICVSRAVANLSTLAEYCIPFISKEGKFISYKSEFSEEEKENAEKAIFELGGTVCGSVIEQLPLSDIQRRFILIDKKRRTPNKYPRKAGVPSKKPIM